MSIIQDLYALEILDSRGRPTVQLSCKFENGAIATVSVPSGRSTGRSEAHELRDGDKKRYRGLGCRKAVANINTEMLSAVRDKEFPNQEALDRFLIELDGTPNKSRLGANAVLAVSLAFAKCSSVENQVTLFQHFANLLGQPLRTLPRPTINLFSGGHHAGWQVPLQDVLIVPASANSIDEAMAVTYEVYQSAADMALRKYNIRPLSADEGGLAPDFESAEHMLEDTMEAIQLCGLQPGRDVAIAIDVASSHFYDNGTYRFGSQILDSEGMIERFAGWLEKYPIVSLEDALAEDDWEHWPLLKQRLQSKTLVLGDDFLCTNPERIQRAIAADAANALLLKVNQIGTLTEALEAYRLARSAGWQVTVSARSGETEDNWLADLSVGWGGDQIKVGSITQSERLAKYNRLLTIERETELPLVKWPNG